MRTLAQSDKKEPEEKKDDLVVETERNGMIVETTYDQQGRVIAQKTWVKPDKRGRRDPRAGGPLGGVEQSPL